MNPMAIFFFFRKKHIPRRKIKSDWKLDTSFPRQFMRCSYCFSLVANDAVRKKVSDKYGWILITEAFTDDTEFALNNLYNTNTEKNWLNNFLQLTNLLENFDLTKSKPIIFTGDFNLFLNRSLETKGVNLKSNHLESYLTLKTN